jgi:hypothetical protein
MSSYIDDTWHPVKKRIRRAVWIDNYFGRHQYGVCFYREYHVYRTEEVEAPNKKPQPFLTGASSPRGP